MTPTLPLNPRKVSWPAKQLEAEAQNLFWGLLNHLDVPTLVVDVDSRLILAANSAFMKISAFPLMDVSGRSVDAILPDDGLGKLQARNSVEVTIMRNSRPPQTVMGQIQPIEGSNQLAILELIPLEDYYQTDIRNQALWLKAITEIASLNEMDNFEEAVNWTTGTLKTLLAAEVVSIYHADCNVPELRKISTIENGVTLPDRIPSSDLIRLGDAQVWIQGKRVQTELHISARMQNLSYLGTCPLGNARAQVGLIVVGDRSKQAMQRLPQILRLFAAFLTSAHNYFLLVEELRQKNLALEQGLSIQSSIVESVQEGIVLVTPEMIVSDINPAAEWLLGYGDWEVRGQPVENVLIGSERIIPALQNARQGQPTHNISGVSLNRRNGQSFPAHIQVLPIVRDERPLAIAIIINDVSEHEEIRLHSQQLEHRALLGEFTAIFAHEVRNPINNISTGIQLITSRLSADDPNLEVMNRMENDCQRLNHLMESVLTFSRTIEPKFEMMDVGFLLQRILDRWRPRMTRVNVKAFYQTDLEHPEVYGDARMLEQVFTNLISNAVDVLGTRGNGTIAVKVSQGTAVGNRPQIQVTVSDDGPGIPEHVREHIFEPFVTTKSQGTGLGLAITKRIVTAHRGSITVNTFPGGTMFFVNLPASEDV
ncbi:protein containg PAS domain S-box [Longilinea arvoryzae]|uniref:histidine kinase n=1 Tax=Longilinea arvoryzae TaxID=360412 RepID=A0A0S7BAU8_9CHLR|nr:ATP-binding protein [Longilinea arvoryzae]GAP14831.1 protein containg PAS domain S-box [Longilinea arvoryzae]